MTTPADANPYDELPYVGHPFHFTHPNRLSALGTLFGMQPAPPARCRLLEIGCGDGVNLLSMAYVLPESEFFGIDLAAQPLTVGRGQAAALGVRNLRLEAMDVLDFPAGAGVFDYIVIHGLYSWVPPNLRDRLLALCGAHLAPQGIALVSYKAMPGSAATNIARELMLFCADRLLAANLEERMAQGLDRLRIAAEARPNDAYQHELGETLEILQQGKKFGSPGAWYRHDLCGPFSEGFYVHHFLEHAGRHGLQFVCESEPEFARPPDLTFEALTTLNACGDDVVAHEQFLDFYTNRRFRSTLLCRRETTPERTQTLRRVRGMYVAGNPRPKPGVKPPANPWAEQAFKGGVNVDFVVSNPAVKAAMGRLLQAWPAALPFADLLAADTSEADADDLAETLLRLWPSRVAELYTYLPTGAAAAGDRPEASALARLRVAQGAQPINLRHYVVAFEDPLLRQFLRLLDGTRTRTEILRDLRLWMDANKAAHPGSAQWPTREQMAASLDMLLRDLSQRHLLVG